MAFNPLLDEVEELHRVCIRLEQLASEHTHVTDEMLAVESSVRNSATLLTVIVATRLHGGDGQSRWVSKSYFCPELSSCDRTAESTVRAMKRIKAKPKPNKRRLNRIKKEMAAPRLAKSVRTQLTD